MADQQRVLVYKDRKIAAATTAVSCALGRCCQRQHKTDPPLVPKRQHKIDPPVHVIEKWRRRYNERRPHSSQNYITPEMAYFGVRQKQKA